MTETPVGTQTFNAKFEQSDVPPGGTVLAMRLSFMPDAANSWSAEGHGSVVRGSTNPPLDLQFPLKGTLKPDPVEPIEPPLYILQVHSHFADGRVGTSLRVRLTAQSITPPSESERLRFQGEYTWMAGEPVTVKDATVEMINESGPIGA
jgi:hypothetical protein